MRTRERFTAGGSVDRRQRRQRYYRLSVDAACDTPDRQAMTCVENFHFQDTWPCVSRKANDPGSRLEIVTPGTATYPCSWRPVNSLRAGASTPPKDVAKLENLTGSSSNTIVEVSAMVSGNERITFIVRVETRAGSTHRSLRIPYTGIRKRTDA